MKELRRWITKYRCLKEDDLGSSRAVSLLFFYRALLNLLGSYLPRFPRYATRRIRLYFRSFKRRRLPACSMSRGRYLETNMRAHKAGASFSVAQIPFCYVLQAVSCYLMQCLYSRFLPTKRCQKLFTINARQGSDYIILAQTEIVVHHLFSVPCLHVWQSIYNFRIPAITPSK